MGSISKAGMTNLSNDDAPSKGLTPVPSGREASGAPHLSRRAFVARATALTAGGLVALVPELGCSSGAKRPARTISPASGPGPRARLRPPSGTALVIAGQSAVDLGGAGPRGPHDGYLDHVSITPAGITTRLFLPAPGTPVPAGGPLAGDTVVDLLSQPRFRSCLLHLSMGWVPNRLPSGADQVAENKAAQRALINGDLDPWLDALADWCRDEKRPVLLRAGYEFNRFATDTFYDRHLYAPAFRHIVRRFRARGADNVAFVWASANLNWGAPTGSPFHTTSPDTWDFDAWYPGDDYVDWFGFSYWFPDDPDTVMLEQARRRHKPVLLTETTPAGYDLRTGQHFDLTGKPLDVLTSAELTKAWFDPYFSFIQKNRDVVAGFHYITTNWAADPFWANVPPFIRSDARLWEDPALLEHWTDTLRQPQYLAGDRDLWAKLGLHAPG